MDKLLKLFLGNHQQSSIAGYLMLGFTLWQQYREQFNPTLAAIGVGLFFVLRFMNERVPGLVGLVQSVVAQYLRQAPPTVLVTTPVEPARHQPTPYEQQLMREVETLRGEREAVLEDAANLRRNLTIASHELEQHRAQTNTRINTLPLGDDVLGRG